MKKIVLIVISVLTISATDTFAQIITNFAGGGTTLGDGGPATNASVPFPGFGSFDAAGNYYFSENGCRIRMVDTAGIIHTVAGNGTCGYNGDSGLATDAEINNFCASIVDDTGNIYLADWLNYRVRKVDKATGIIHTIAGNGVATVTGDGGPAIAATTIPHDIYVDAMGNIYIGDSEGVWVRKIDNAGIISKVVGNGIAGYSGDSGLATLASIQEAYGLRIDASGNLIIGCNTRIRKVNISTGIITTIAGTGNSIYNMDGIHADSANFSAYGICFDVIGDLYISDDNNRIRIIDTFGIIHTVAGDGIAGNTGNGGLADSAEINYPEGVAIDRCGNLYIADERNSHIRKVTFDTSCSLTNLGVKKVAAMATEITVYPNPATDVVHIDNIKAPTTYCILNMIGAVMQQGMLQEGGNSIAIQALTPGMYLLELKDNEGQKTVKKVTKE